MNNKGKSNIIFIILIPLVIFLTIIIVDTIISYNTNKIYKVVTENIISEVMNNEELDYEDYYAEIKRLYEYKNYETEMLIVNANEYKVTVNNEHKFFGLISSITNRNGEPAEIDIFGVKFYAKKGSKSVIKVEASRDSNDEIIFEYVDE